MNKKEFIKLMNDNFPTEFVCLGNYYAEYQFCDKHFAPYILIHYNEDDNVLSVPWGVYYNPNLRQIYPHLEDASSVPADYYFQYKQVKNPTIDEAKALVANLLYQIKHAKEEYKLSRIKEDF
jgi:hypothetical protein